MKAYYQFKCDNMDGFIPCDTAFQAYRESMRRFAFDANLNRVTIWKCSPLDMFGTLYRCYTRSDFNHVRILRVARDGVSRTETAIVEKL